MTPRAEEINANSELQQKSYWFFSLYTSLPSFPSLRFCEGHDYLCPIKLRDHSNLSQGLLLKILLVPATTKKFLFSYFNMSVVLSKNDKVLRVIKVEVSNSLRTENKTVSTTFSNSFPLPIEAEPVCPVESPPHLAVFHFDIFTYFYSCLIYLFGYIYWASTIYCTMMCSHPQKAYTSAGNVWVKKQTR